MPGTSAIIKAATAGKMKAVTRLIAEGAAVDDADDSGRTALMWAASGGHSMTVRVLLAAGADPKKADRHYGITPLMLAAHQGHADVVKALLKTGATESAWEALLLARLKRHTEVTELLARVIGRDARGRARLRDFAAA